MTFRLLALVLALLTTHPLRATPGSRAGSKAPIILARGATSSFCGISVSPMQIAASAPTAQSTPASPPLVYTLDFATTFQTIDNFGASDAWSMQFAGHWSNPAREKIARLLFSKTDGIGLSCWRFNLGAGVQMTSIPDRFRTAETFEIAPGQYDWTRQAAEQWMLRQSALYGVEQRLAFVNSPPARMTISGQTNGAGVSRPTNFARGKEPAFATYLADILQHFSAEGLPFDYLSPINEPNVDWINKQEGCRMDNGTVDRVLHATVAEFQQRHLPTKIVGPESTNTTDMLRPASRPRPTTRNSAPTRPAPPPALITSTSTSPAVGDYIDHLTADPAYAAASGHILCHHIYNASEDPSLTREATGLGERLAQHSGWKLWMSEICIMHPKRDLGIDSALTLARMIHATLAMENASAFQWWLALSPYDYRDGLLYTTWKHPGDPEDVTESKMLWALGQYARFIRPGWKRIALISATDHLTQIQSSAYLAPDHQHFAAVFINLGETDEHVTLALPTRSPANLQSWQTSATHNLTPLPVIANTADLPARSIVTITNP